MRIAVIGGRKRRGKSFIFGVLDAFVRKGDSIISGGAPRVDSMAEKYARKRKLKFTAHLPKDWGVRERRKRNARIVAAADVLLAFPSADESDGTWHAIALARKAKKRIAVWRVET